LALTVGVCAAAIHVVWKASDAVADAATAERAAAEIAARAAIRLRERERSDLLLHDLVLGALIVATRVGARNRPPRPSWPRMPCACWNKTVNKKTVLDHIDNVRGKQIDVAAERVRLLTGLFGTAVSLRNASIDPALGTQLRAAGMPDTPLISVTEPVVWP
jgi:hypothetical protein